jgi:hypothetical protein
MQRSAVRASTRPVKGTGTWCTTTGAVSNIGLEHLLVFVLAEVVVEEEALDPDQAVELDPLAQV